MSGATLGMGLVPSFAAWGAAASVLMVALRLVQGFCLGGELPGALTYVVETAPRHAPFVCSVVFSCVTLGVAAATGVSLAVRTWLPAEWWRPSAGASRSSLGGLGGLAELRAAALARGVAGVRANEGSWRRGSRFARCCDPISCRLRWASAGLAATAGFNGLFFAHMAAYMSGVLGYDPRQAVVSQTIGVIVHALGILAVGRLAEHVHPRLLLRAGALGARGAGVSVLCRARRAQPEPDGCCWCWRALCASLVNGSFAVLLTDLFPTRVRFSGVALGFNVAFTIFSGTAPLVATSLIRSTGLETAPAIVMVACGLLTLVGSLGLSRVSASVLNPSYTRRRTLQPAEHSPQSPRKEELSLAAPFSTCSAMTSRWISDVPS